MKAPRHWPLSGEFTGTGEFPAQRASNAENVSIWWRHHVRLIHGNENVVLVTTLSSLEALGLMMKLQGTSRRAQVFTVTTFIFHCKVHPLKQKCNHLTMLASLYHCILLHRKLFRMVQIRKRQHWFRYWLVAEQVIIHYLQPRRHSLLTHICVPGLDELRL